MGTIHIVFGVGKNYLQHLCVVMASILANTESPISFHILSADIEDTDLSALQSLGGNAPFSIALHRISLRDFKDFRLTTTSITIETYFRLSIAEVLPSIERVIYLDADMIVRDDISKLWNEDIEGLYAAVVEDILFGKFKILYGTEQYQKLFDGIRYFNAGVILMNLKELRQKFNFERYHEIYDGFKDIFQLQDQDVLNYAWHGMGNEKEGLEVKLKFLPLCWNRHDVIISTAETMELGYSKEEIRTSLWNPSIVHYTGGDKPWKNPRGVWASAYVAEYFRYLAITPFAKEKRRILQKAGLICAILRFIKHFPSFFKKRCLTEKLLVRSYFFARRLFAKKTKISKVYVHP